LRYTFLALLDYPGSTFLSVPRILTDKFYRAEVLKKVKDPVVRDFWVTEFEGYPDKIRQEAVMPIQNKIGQFLASATIRNIIGQPVTSMNLRQIMDESKIFLVKVSKGIVGEDNSALLGATMVTKIQLAAMSRQDIPRSQRVPFNLYVDEFQNFATESFASILSEARKYNLNLHVANQYIAQMEDSVREAIFGNVGTLITFRVGANDADHLAKEFAPTFTAEDLTNLERYQIYLRMTVDGISSAPFSATTLPLPKNKTENLEKILKVSRERYSTSRVFVEQKLNSWAEELDKIKIDGDQKAKQDKYNKKKKPYFGQNKEEMPVNVELTDDQKKKQISLIDKLKKFQEAKKPADVKKEISIKDNANNTASPIVNNKQVDTNKVLPVDNSVKIIKPENPKKGILSKVIKDKDSIQKADYVKQKLDQLKNQQKDSKIAPKKPQVQIVNKPIVVEENKNKKFEEIGEITIGTDGEINVDVEQD
jgi:hypothetical protein